MAWIGKKEHVLEKGNNMTQKRDLVMSHLKNGRIYWMMLVALLLQLAIPYASRAQDGSGGTQNILHEVGASARAFALGRAYVALADEPSAVFWNPAGLEYVPRMSFSLFHTPLIADASYDFLGFVYPTLQYGTVGLGFSRVGVGDIVVTDIYNVQTEETLSDFDFSEIYIAYAKKIPFNLTAGVTFKVHRQNFSGTGQVSSAFGLDGGLMYRPNSDSPLLSGLSLGFHFQNLIRPQLKLGAYEDTLANRMSFGVMKSIPIGFSGKMNILLDYVQGQFEGGSIHAGAEYQFRDMGTVRLGFDRDAPAFGAGVSYQFVDIDYSFSNLSTDGEFNPSHRFSLTFNLGKSREEKIFLAEQERKEFERRLVERTKEEERQVRVEQHLENGRQFFAEKRYFDAYSEFQQVIANDPFNKEAKSMFDSSRAQIQSQFDQRQEQAIAQAIDKKLELENQKYVELHFERGKVFLDKNQFTDAMIQFNLALERSPDDPIILEAINTTQRRLNAEVSKLVSDARQEFQRGNFTDALRIVGEAMVLTPDVNELQGELQTLERRIKLQQYIIDGLALLELGEYEKALGVFEKALELDPTSQTIKEYYNKAKLNVDTKRERMSPDDERQHLVATEHFLAGRYEKALEIWKQLADKYPTNKKVQDAIKTTEDRIRRTK